MYEYASIASGWLASALSSSSQVAMSHHVYSFSPSQRHQHRSFPLFARERREPLTRGVSDCSPSLHARGTKTTADLSPITTPTLYYCVKNNHAMPVHRLISRVPSDKHPQSGLSNVDPTSQKNKPARGSESPRVLWVLTRLLHLL